MAGCLAATRDLAHTGRLCSAMIDVNLNLRWAFGAVGLENHLDQGVPDDILLGEADYRHLAGLVEAVDRVSQALAGARRQVVLRRVPGHDHPGILAEPGQEHLHLRGRGVLCLI